MRSVSASLAADALDWLLDPGGTVRRQPSFTGVVADQSLGGVETQQGIAIEQFRTDGHERRGIVCLRMPSSRAVDEVKPRDGHGDMKFLRHTFRRRKTLQPLEQFALGLRTSMTREIQDRETDVIGVRERRQRSCLEAVNQLVIGEHLSSLSALLATGSWRLAGWRPFTENRGARSQKPAASIIIIHAS